MIALCRRAERIARSRAWLFVFALAFWSLWSSPASACGNPFPLSTRGRYVVNACGERFPLRAVNWYGASDTSQVVGGLSVRPLSEIAQEIRALGFNAVRLPFSNQMLHETRAVEERYIAANPQLRGLVPLQVFDATVEALSLEGIAVILNNHTTISEWCCGYDYNGLWHHYADGAYSQTEEEWLADWLMLVDRYVGNDAVVGADLRNEVRTERWRSTFIPQAPNWGSGDENDWHRAAEYAGNRILDRNPNLLVVVEGINWWGILPQLGGERPHLKPVRDRPISLMLPDKLVYAAHTYGFIGPRHNGNDDWSRGQTKYGEMDRDTLFRTLDEEFGYVTEASRPYTAPVWVSEFGVGRNWASDQDKAWFANVIDYLISRDLDFSYWPLNPERVDGSSSDDYGVLDSAWRPISRDQDWRIPHFERLMRAQGYLGPVSAPSFRSLWFLDSDDNQSWALRDDWHAGAYKGTCPDGTRIVGLSRRARRGVGDLRALCSDVTYGSLWSTGREWTTAVDYQSSALPHVPWDWAGGFTKYECPLDHYAAGASKRWWGSSGLLCERADRPLGNACRTLWFDRGDQRESSSGGDWAPGAFKGQCADDEYVAGLAQRDGEAAALLCCR